MLHVSARKRGKKNPGEKGRRWETSALLAWPKEGKTDGRKRRKKKI